MCISLTPIPECANVLDLPKTPRYHRPFKSQALEDSSGEVHHPGLCGTSKLILCCCFSKCGMQNSLSTEIGMGVPPFSLLLSSKTFLSLGSFNTTLWWPVTLRTGNISKQTFKNHVCEGAYSSLYEGRLGITSLEVKVNHILSFYCSRKENKGVNSPSYNKLHICVLLIKT